MARTDRESYRRGLAMVLASTVAWSTAGYFTRLITVDSWTMQLWRAAFGALTALAFMLIAERGRLLAGFRALGWPGVAFSFASGLGMTAYLGSLRLTTVAHVAIIYATVPFVSAVLAAVVLRERTSGLTLVACLIAFAGVAVTVSDSAGGGSTLGDLVAVAMTVLMAVMIVLARRYRDISMIAAALVSALIAGLIALPLASPWPIDGTTLLELALFGVSNMGFGLILFTIGSKLMPATESALISSLEAPLAPFWVWLAFGETPLMTTVIGGALVMTAVLAHVLIATRRPAPAAG